MKNIEKYPNTWDAWEAYAAHRKSEGLPFEEWLDREYVEPHEPTLLEAAETVIDCFYRVRHMSEGGSVSLSHGDVDRLKEALEREKSKPIRNVDRYATAEEARDAYDKMCQGRCCNECAFSALNDGNYRCQIKWLYAEADAGKEEVTK